MVAEDSVVDQRQGADIPDASSHERFLNAGEFLELLISPRRLLRADATGGEIRGLLDETTGQRFVISEDELFASPRKPAVGRAV